MRKLGIAVVDMLLLGATLEVAAVPAEASPVPVSFLGHADFQTGKDPYALAVGDLNGDAIPDLAVANSVSNTVSVLLGESGWFIGPNNYATGNLPMSVAMADLNDDGALDLATANSSSGNVSVLLGNGDGTFAAHVDYATGGQPYSVTVGDLNRDTRPDLATANYASGNVSVLLGNGDGTLAAHVDYAAGSGAFSVVAADVNEDGVLDLVVANYDSGNVSVLLGNGDGTFAAHVDYASTGSRAYSAAVGDLNRDTHADLAIANPTSASVAVLLGNGDGTFGLPTGFFVPAPNAVAVVDVNGDLLPDVVSANQTNSASLLLNTTGLTVPDTPMIGTATAGDGEATVSWTAPASDGGSPIVYYVVTAYVGYFPADEWTFNAAATAGTIAALTNGTQYRFRVRAVNIVGISGYSKVSNPVVPVALTAPAAPTIGTAIGGNAQATVSWTAPASDGGSPITGYVVTAYVGYSAVKTRIFNSTLTTQTVTGLTNGTQYRFRVRAYNAVGISGYSRVTNPVTPTA